MPRLFIGLDPPPGMKAHLLALMHGVTGARWQTAAQLHLTLRFLGENDRTEDIAAVLREVRHPSFELSLSGTGGFERSGHAHALWAGVTPETPLLSLHATIEAALAGIRSAPDAQVYRPHITLARLSREAAGVDAFLTCNSTLRSAAFAVDRFCLYESHLTPDGSIYIITEWYGLSTDTEA